MFLWDIDEKHLVLAYFPVPLCNQSVTNYRLMASVLYDGRSVAILGAIMARYTCSFTISLSIDHLQPLLLDLLQGCDLEIQYYNADYILAREIPGNVSFSKLVKVEVFIDRSSATETESRMNIVIKNEELPLQLDNHCRQMFEFVKQEIEHSRHWHLIESLAG
ncbi:hypothetical protein NIES2109_28520 [Nostoc sp. HK-01]|uniref:Uncharacterized protein n=2 Tax=Nostoc cycadae TaxID=246795 RepID=A0A2H6LPV5_9NOSO|nr:hypothetical protein NIES2109_28520 [Nostoc sp. HK-01]GBE95255.1 hypothetical protein NCWK1_5040 [Nostoc cycadae WK-1]